MKVDVDNQGWQMVEGSVRPAIAGANALDTAASTVVAPGTEAPASAEVPSAKPSSGVYAKVAARSTADEIAVMDTVPAPSSGESVSVIPPAAGLPADLLSAISLDDHDTEE
jgi:hypothetical protein